MGVIAHGGAGKTSLVEAMLYDAGAVTRLGRVDEGTATTDFEPEEVKRKVTISAALAACEWQQQKMNIIDTPGYADFVAEVRGGLRAADSALVVLCAASGVEVETEKGWAYAATLGLPRMLFINKMDRENADFAAVLAEIAEKFGAGAVPVQLPIGTEDSFTGIIDLLTMKALTDFDKQGKPQREEEIPEDLWADAELAKQKLVESAAEMDDALLEKYLEGQELTDAEIRQGLIAGVRSAKIFPVLCGSAQKNIAVRSLLDMLVTCMPSPADCTVVGTHPVSGQSVERALTDPFSALVFKTTADPFVGRLSYLRVFSGVLKPDSTIYNASRQKNERIGSLFTLRGKHQDPMNIVGAGDIAVVAKLQETTTGDTLADKEHPIVFAAIDYPTPMLTMRGEAKNKHDEDKIGSALQKLQDEDRTLKVSKEADTGQLLITGMGDLHIDIMVERLKRKFGVEILLKLPKVPYRETIRGSVKIEGKHKKQSGGHGQYGHVWLQLEPLAPGGEFAFVDAIFGGSVPRQYIPAVEKGVKEALHGGVLAGYPIVDVKVTLLDGSYHTVDSSEMAFKIASSLAVRKGVLQAKPVLLEPIYDLEIRVPDVLMGDIIGDLNSKRGHIMGMEPLGDGNGIIKARVPLAEIFRYTVDLRSLTQGRGSFTKTFAHYEEAPQKVADAVISAAKKDMKALEEA